jgi:hypothetical protein
LQGRASDIEFPETAMTSPRRSNDRDCLSRPKGLSRRKDRAAVAGPREMVIRIAACGICASDCKCWSGAKMFWGAQSLGQGAGRAGHEFFGYVERWARARPSISASRLAIA